MAKVLIVDDNPVDRALMAGIARKRGDEVKELPNGTLVLEIARAATPDVILMDVVMEGVDGFGLCRKLKKDPDTREIPVVLVSARTSENDQFWGKRNGAVAYLCKPVKPEDLNAAIDFALSSQVRSAESPWRSWAIPSGLNYRGPKPEPVRPAEGAKGRKQTAAAVQSAPASEPQEQENPSEARGAAAAAIEAFRSASDTFRRTRH